MLRKMKVIGSMILSRKYVVIAIKKDNGKENVIVDFHANVTNSELKFYTNYLMEYKGYLSKSIFRFKLCLEYQNIETTNNAEFFLETFQLYIL